MAKNRTLRQGSVQAVFTKQKTTPKSGLVINLKQITMRKTTRINMEIFAL